MAFSKGVRTGPIALVGDEGRRQDAGGRTLAARLGVPFPRQRRRDRCGERAQWADLFAAGRGGVPRTGAERRMPLLGEPAAVMPRAAAAVIDAATRASLKAAR
jgi:hypothetical protein